MKNIKKNKEFYKRLNSLENLYQDAKMDKTNPNTFTSKNGKLTHIHYSDKARTNSKKTQYKQEQFKVLINSVDMKKKLPF